MLGRLRRMLRPASQWGRESFSQEGEDLIVDRIIGSGASGFYVDVGAHHPYRFSNTYLFYRRGWSGLCIDPLPGMRAAFAAARPRDVALEIGIAEHAGTARYFMFNEPALNTFSEPLARERDGVGAYRIVEVRDIPLLPLASVLESHMPAGRRIDFMSVDVEGYDLQALRSNDWNRYRPRIVVSESLSASMASLDEDPVVAFLRGVGYSPVAKTGCSIVFERTAE